MIEEMNKYLNTHMTELKRSRRWTYYVKSEGLEGRCNRRNKDIGMLFMVLPPGDPRQINFRLLGSKIGFLKICYDGGVPFPLKNCPFDACSRTNSE